MLCEHLTQIRAIIAAQPDISRAQLAREICESNSLYRANGAFQTLSCRKKWNALMVYISQNPIPPEKPLTLREAIHFLACLGGFVGRKCDGEPGTKALWLVLQRRDDLVVMWKIIMPHPT